MRVPRQAIIMEIISVEREKMVMLWNEPAKEETRAQGSRTGAVGSSLPAEMPPDYRGLGSSSAPL